MKKKETDQEVKSAEETPVEEIKEGVVAEEKELEPVVDTVEEQSEKFQTQEEPEEEKVEEPERKIIIQGRKSRKTLWTILILFCIFALIAVFCIINKTNTSVYKNVKLEGKNLEGMSSAEVVTYLQTVETKLEGLTISVKQGDKVITEVTAQEIEFGINKDKTLKKIMEFGRTENALTNNVNIAKAIISEYVVKPEYTYSEDKLDTIVQEIRASIENKVKDDIFSFDENKYVLTITRGTSGNGIDILEFKQDIVKAFIAERNTYNLKITTQTPAPIDVDVIYSKVTRQAKDAYIDETVSPIKFVKHVVGIDIDKEELRTLLAKEENTKEKAVVKYKVKITQPNVKLSDIKWELYVDKIASTTTYFTASDANRSSNLKTGLGILEGTVVMPGEIFSFNSTMGDCGLSSRGFKPAATFKAGKVVSEVGGGICQVASTLYNSALKANLEIVKRSNHALPVGYVKPSLDATVYYPYVDLKFKNTRNYPIKIITSYNGGGKMTISIMGTSEEVEYDVTLSSVVTGNVDSKKEYVNDASLAAGITKVIKKGTNGYTSCGYRIVKLNGKLISKTLLSKDTYKGTVTTIAVGTKSSETVVDPKQVATP